MRKLLLLALLFIILAGGATLGFSAFTSHNKSASARTFSDTFLSEVLANNPNDSYGSYSNSAQQNVTTDAWAIQVNKLSIFFDGNKPVYKSTDAGTKLTTISYDIESASGPYTVSVILTPASSGWEVSQFVTAPQNNG